MRYELTGKQRENLPLRIGHLHRKCLSLKFAGHCVIFNGDLKPFIIFFRFAKSNSNTQERDCMHQGFPCCLFAESE